MLDIFFTNKIPGTNDTWTDELIQVATIFDEFDGLPYDRDDLTARFEAISHRYPDARDNADYRDEYGAYASYLGLVNYEVGGNRLITRVNPRAKKLLCGILPDPEAYMRLQMALLQYPNPIGARFFANGNIWPESLSLNKRVELIGRGIRTVPFRLILKILIRLCEDHGPEEAYLTYPEIWACLFTQSKAVCTLSPDGSELAADVVAWRRGNRNAVVNIPANALRNLHILKHTGLIQYRDANQTLHRQLVLETDACIATSKPGRIARQIADLELFFETPATNSTHQEIADWTRQVLESGEWAKYFSGDFLGFEDATVILQPVSPSPPPANLSNQLPGIGADLIELQGGWQEREVRAAQRQRRMALPEETEVRRERANLKHRELMKLVSDRLRNLGITPYFNQFIDIATREPGNEKLFEIKSCRIENILSQVRKGVSQLYEYRYRHDLLHGAKLILVLEERPNGEMAWLVEYLTTDRRIALCWLDGDETLAAPNACQASLGNLVHYYEQ